MKKVEKKEIVVSMRLPESTHAKIKAMAEMQGFTIGGYCRYIIEKAADDEFLKAGQDEMLALIRKAVRDSLKPTEDRLAKITAKTNIQAGTALYLMMEALEKSNKDVERSKEIARKKAVLDLRRKEHDYGE